MATDIKKLLAGTGVAIITPFKANGALDLPALEKVINFIIANGVQYIVTLGTTGETPVLSKEEKKEIILFTYDTVAGRVPVVVGAGGNDTNGLLKEIEALPLQKATALLSASPYYNKPSQQGIFQHYELVAKASPVPVILYNVPGRTGRNMDAATTIRLAHEVDNIKGIKEASGDMLQCMEILRDCPKDFLVVSGDDALALPQLACGMDGVISVAANCFPKQFSEMVAACLQGNYLKAVVLNNPLIKAYHLLFTENNPAGAKAFMHHMNLIENEMRLPVVPVSEGIYDAIKDYLNT